MAATRLRAEAEVFEESDAELVRVGSAGNRAVFAELYRRHGQVARRVARTVAANDDDAADAAAEAFTRVFDLIVSGRAPQMEFRAYLIAATRNAAIDQLRRSDRPVPGTDLVGGNRRPDRLGPSEHLAAGEDSELVAQAFQGLPARWQSILWLTEVEGVPAREAAGVLGLSPNNVSQLAVRARARLRERYLQAHVRNHAQPRCQRTVDHLGAYLAGSLATGQRARVEDHLQGCAACRDRLAEVEDLGMSLRRAVVPAPLIAGALAWIRRGSHGKNRPRPPVRFAPLPASVGGSVAVPVDGRSTGRPSGTGETRAPGGGAASAMSSSPLFQTVSSMPVSAVAPLVAAGPALRMALRVAMSVLALLPVLGSGRATDSGLTAVVAPTRPATRADAVPVAAPRPQPPPPPDPPAAAAVPEAALAAPPLPVTHHPQSIVAQALGPVIDVYGPGASSPWTYLDNPQPSGAPLVFLVVEQHDDWLKVLLPVRPNGSTGWLRRQDVTLTTHYFSIVIELAAHRITAFDGNDPFLSEPVAVGTSDTPTPGGLYYTKELIRPTDADGHVYTNGPYGPWAFGLSGFSDVLFDFGGGDGVIGIHGTNDPSALGHDVSHGCIRMSNEGISTLAQTLPPGVPVEIVG